VWGIHFGGPKEVLRYLARCTHRVAISNRRLIACDDKGVTFIAHHCRAMALYPQPVFHEMVDLLRRARVAIVSDPHTGPLHARGKELPPFPEDRSAREGLLH
jgi:hypothetical protein